MRVIEKQSIFRLVVFVISVFTTLLVHADTLCSGYSGLPVHWGKDSKAGMVIIRGGEFSFGTQLGYPEEQPVHLIKIADFWMDKTEVTVAQFADFVKSTGYISEAHRDGGGVVFRVPSSDELNTRPYAWWQFKKGANWQHPTGENTQAIANHPVTLITFNDALAYAKWLGRDLPTETEWEYAAKAGETRPALLEKQPRNTQGTPQANFWQGHFPAENTHEDGYIGLAPVGCFEANSFHLYDMIGNVWEQTKDIYTPSHEADQVTTDLSADRIKPDQLMVIKGGSHLCGQDFCVRYRASAREGHEANLPISHIGFRTVARNE